MYRGCRFILVWCLLFPLLTAYNPQEAVTTYRLVHSDGRIIAYTEIMPHVGDVYWQSEEDMWYQVVRVEGDTGWLEATKAPVEYSTRDTLQLLLVASVVGLGICLWLVKLRRK